ncbi:Copia protein [Vitis vinifera]|uniref:Copia protein n=1 Tax=Vitis vinifera TaxID=29760 RepID=A0A438J9D1_VITVI|nr:Copia protein [Vitis vinifera]
MSLEDAIIHIRIEEQNQNRDNIEKAKELSSKANGNCFVCGKSRHHAAKCRHKKRTEKSNSKANLTEIEVIIAVIFSKVSMVTSMKDWVVDYVATMHIYGNRSVFNSYATIKEGEEQVFMGDSRSTPVIGKGKVLLKLTSGKVFVLCDVLHVLDIRWNLVLVSLLGKAGVRILFDSDKIVLTKNDAFVGKGYCNQDHGIIHETTPPYSPESNGIAERKNRTLEEMMNAMVVSSGAPLNLWGEAILSACHIQNKIPYKKTGKTPYELWKGYAPNIAYLKVWGV